MRSGRICSIVLAITVALGLISRPAAQTNWLGAATSIASGVEFFESHDAALSNPSGPTAVYLLKLDPAQVSLSSAHARDEVMGLETADVIANRHHAIAAVNAGFFNTTNGDPASVLKIAGELVSDATVVRGVVAWTAAARAGKQLFTFDQLSAKQEVHFSVGGSDHVVPIDGVDTTRARGKLMLYTPMYHSDTDTAPGGTEIIASGSPLVVREIRRDLGHTPIPRNGIVLSYGGVDLPEDLAALVPGTRLSLATNWKSSNGLPPSLFDQAHDIVNGAGLLRRGGDALTDWSTEALSVVNFTDMRHPRTMIGVDARGFVWLVAIDGRRPDYAVGMNFKELQSLSDRLELRDALNLDGGGSVTMVVGGKIVNKPSDAAGPRAVSDVILVTSKR